MDLDECMVHTLFEYRKDEVIPSIAGIETLRFDMEKGQEGKAHMRVRPGLRDFLHEVSSYCDMYAFTAADPVYARPAFKLLDPKEKYFQKMWYRDSLTSDEESYIETKDLSLVFGEDYIAERTIIIDDSIDNFLANPDNGIPIAGFTDQASDRALTDLLPLVKALSEVKDVRPVLADMFKMREKLSPFLRK
jgi:Dullard-like phosphatase family protein